MASCIWHDSWAKSCDDMIHYNLIKLQPYSFGNYALVIGYVTFIKIHFGTCAPMASIAINP